MARRGGEDGRKESGGDRCPLHSYTPHFMAVKCVILQCSNPPSPPPPTPHSFYSRIQHTHRLIDSSIHTFIHSYIHTFIDSYIDTHIHSIIRAFMHSYDRASSRSAPADTSNTSNTSHHRHRHLHPTLLSPIPSLHPSPHIPNPAPRTLHPTPHTAHSTLRTHTTYTYTAPYIPHSTPYTVPGIPFGSGSAVEGTSGEVSRPAPLSERDSGQMRAKPNDEHASLGQACTAG
jgi:hypothetical protein